MHAVNMVEIMGRFPSGTVKSQPTIFTFDNKYNKRISLQPSSGRKKLPVLPTAGPKVQYGAKKSVRPNKM